MSCKKDFDGNLLKLYELNRNEIITLEVVLFSTIGIFALTVFISIIAFILKEDNIAGKLVKLGSVKYIIYIIGAFINITIALLAECLSFEIYRIGFENFKIEPKLLPLENRYEKSQFINTMDLNGLHRISNRILPCNFIHENKTYYNKFTTLLLLSLAIFNISVLGVGLLLCILNKDSWHLIFAIAIFILMSLFEYLMARLFI